LVSSQTSHGPKGGDKDEEGHSHEYGTHHRQEVFQGGEAAAPAQQAEPRLQAQ